MPPPLEPPLAVACYWNRPGTVKRLLADGASLSERTPTGREFGGRLQGYSPIDICCHFTRVECLRHLLATGNCDQLDRRGPGPHEETPLLKLCQLAGNTYLTLSRSDVPVVEDPGGLRTRRYRAMVCIKMLLAAGASLEPELMVLEGPSLDELTEVGLNALDLARLLGNVHLVRLLEDETRYTRRYSTRTHARFPRPARYAAAELLRLCYQIESGRYSGVLAPVWIEHVLPFLVSRTSRGALPPIQPTSLLLEVMPTAQIRQIVADGEKAKLELQRRGLVVNTQ